MASSINERRPSTARDAGIKNEPKLAAIDDHVVTGNGEITVKQSILPVSLVTILFFMWGFAYGLLDVLNAHFQVALNITQGMSGGLQAAYFGTYKWTEINCLSRLERCSSIKTAMQILIITMQAPISLAHLHIPDGSFVDLDTDGHLFLAFVFMASEH